MLTAVVTRGAHLQVVLVASATGATDTAGCEFPPDAAKGETTCGEGPNPIMPEVKELAWGGGAFVVFALLMRFVLHPRLKRGMDARYAHIRDGHEQADAMRAAAKAEVAEYETALAAVKLEANERIEAARRTLESERTARLGEVNARIASKREAAAEQARVARESTRADVASAAADVASRTVELSIGTSPSAGTVRAAVDAAMSVGAAS